MVALTLKSPRRATENLHPRQLAAVRQRNCPGSTSQCIYLFRCIEKLSGGHRQLNPTSHNIGQHSSEKKLIITLPTTSHPMNLEFRRFSTTEVPN